MKRFIAEVLVFFLPLLVAAPFIDAFISGNLKKSQRGELGAWNDVYAGRINSDVVFYGASRTMVQFDPQIVSEALGVSAYNLGINGHNFWLQYLRHSTLLKYNTKPKIIVQAVDMTTLDKRPDLYDPDQFLPYMLRDPQVEAATSSYEGYSHLDYHVPLLRYYGKAMAAAQALILFVDPALLPPDRVRGYQAMDVAWNGDWERAKATMLPIETVPDQGTVRLFEAYLEECRRMGIKVIFVSGPEYIEAQDFESNRAQIFAIFSSLSKKYGIPFLDYSRDHLSFDTHYFYNSQHLNKTGAELFTRELTMALRPYVLEATARQQGQTTLTAAH